MLFGKTPSTNFATMFFDFQMYIFVVPFQMAFLWEGITTFAAYMAPALKTKQNKNKQYENHLTSLFAMVFQIQNAHLQHKIHTKSFIQWSLMNILNLISILAHSSTAREPRQNFNRPISQIPQCSCSISHNAPFKSEVFTFLLQMLHCGIWNRCIWGLVNLIYGICYLSIYFLTMTPYALDPLTHWGRDKMASIFQTTFSIAFSWMKMLKFRLRFHWSLFSRVQLTIFQHWFR